MRDNSHQPCTLHGCHVYTVYLDIHTIHRIVSEMELVWKWGAPEIPPNFSSSSPWDCHRLGDNLILSLRSPMIFRMKSLHSMLPLILSSYFCNIPSIVPVMAPSNSSISSQWYSTLVGTPLFQALRLSGAEKRRTSRCFGHLVGRPWMVQDTSRRIKKEKRSSILLAFLGCPAVWVRQEKGNKTRTSGLE